MGTITFEQFLAMPDDEKPALEYACGEVMQKPMPDLPHMRLQGFFTMLLLQFLARTALGIAGPELRCIFGPPGRQRVFVPDVAFVS